ncbi:MAG: hypothetical protein QME94_06490, partial [Anaerolineae bacterium]|nr:hypothetical protein [Anaerolineae bacterium]
WHELSWYEWPLESPGYIDTFSTDVKATSSKLTLFVRGWKKWKTVDSEGDFNLDGISLVGPAPSGEGQQGSQLPSSGAGLILPGAGALLGLALAARGGRALLTRRRALDRSAGRRV